MSSVSDQKLPEGSKDVESGNTNSGETAVVEVKSDNEEETSKPKEMECETKEKEEDYLTKLFREKFLAEPAFYVDLDLSEKDVSKQKSCINAQCRSGENFVAAPALAMKYYYVPEGRDLAVCKECLENAMDFYENLEAKFRNVEPVHAETFPRNAEVIIVDDDEDAINDAKKGRDETVKNAKEMSQIVTDTIADILEDFKFDTQVDETHKLIKKGMDDLETQYKETEKILHDASDGLYKFMRELYETYATPRESLTPYEVPYEELRPCYNDLGYFDRKDENDCVVTGQVDEQAPPTLPPHGVYRAPELKPGDKVYAMKVSMFSEWVPSLIEEIITKTVVDKVIKTYRVVISGLRTNQKEGYKKDVSGQFIAYYDPPPVRLSVGTRVIAEHLTPVRGSLMKKYFSGIVAEFPSHLNKYRYLVFFDDGFYSYASHQSVRAICERKNNVWEHFIDNLRPFIKQYLLTFPERRMLKSKKLDSVRTEYRGVWKNARVIDIDCSLINVLFLEDKHSEWLYRGSPRLHPMQQNAFMVQRRFASRRTGPYMQHYEVSDDEDPSAEGNKPSRAVARKSSTRLPNFIEIDNNQRTFYERRALESKRNAPPQQDDGKVVHKAPENIIRPKCYRPHECSSECVSWITTTEESTRNLNILAVPALYGFTRETDIVSSKVTYIAPCGRHLCTISEVLNYLTKTDFQLSIDMFDFDPWVNIFDEYVVPSQHVVLPDLSFGIESIPIGCVNTINGVVPTYMDYMTQRRGSEGVCLNLDPEFLVGCDCTDDCQDKSKCSCWQLTVTEGNVNNYSKRDDYQQENVGYQYKRLPNLVATGIYECNVRCKCRVKTCLNRVVQHPLKHKLQLFMTKDKGWGTRCLNDIPAGTFICVYVGNIFTETVANEDGRLYGDEYFAELDYIEVVEGNKEGYEEFVDPNECFNDTPKEITDRNSEDEFEQHGWTPPSSGLGMSLRKRTKKKTSKEEGSNSEDEDDPDSEEEANEDGTDVTNDDSSAIDRRPSVRSYYGKDESVYIMDAKAAGNIGRYLNHSCDPNIFVQNVFVDTHDLRFPWVAFFSLKFIRAGTELTWDYRYEVGSVPGKKLKCFCGSELCRGRLL